MAEVGELLAARDHVFLDFDGPVCAVFAAVPALEVAERLKPLVGHALPAEIVATGDPLDVLAYAATCGPSTARVVERQLGRLEQEAVTSATPTPGVEELLEALVARGFTVTIVSNNSADAVRSFLVLRDLARHVRGISARTTADPAVLKPSPALLEAAMRSVGAAPRQCVMVGDSARDLEAARAAGVASIAFAPDPARRAKLEALCPDAVVGTLADLRLAG
ncbi:HAD family hydrolase [Amycolatopsis sp. H20-H5]|uniref:HAD family hydrolase n=1 Tax=Amycolatopsis sp. H20-H5 TaxID=3046309 RepID=UPI002DBC8BDD|nr:HAD family hydrolase [Amycolatopsis sp. H20-H5]MEC3980249.1 HAD family hydrolase [Amycolatopsis sp. H20-H5]